MSASSNVTVQIREEPELCAQFSNFVASHGAQLEDALKNHLPIATGAGTERFNDALTYAVFPGGKRLRPHLTFIASRLGGASDQQALALACAIEFIHTSSIVLDDLPCMDDAELRRNIPTLHLVFGEAIALLVAVSLLNQAYGLFGKSCADVAQAERLPNLISEATACLGNSGMIAGQAAELALSGTPADASVLSSRELKTSGLMRLMMVAGALISGASRTEINALATFGECLGQAYQIYDDLADKFSDHQQTGKSVGQDLRHLRPTVVLGLTDEEIQVLAARIIQTGKDALDQFGSRPEAELLRSAADQIVGGLNPAAARKIDGSLHSSEA